jgi:tetratricopeptide (TPR) repeat protein
MVTAESLLRGGIVVVASAVVAFGVGTLGLRPARTQPLPLTLQSPTQPGAPAPPVSANNPLRLPSGPESAPSPQAAPAAAAPAAAGVANTAPVAPSAGDGAIATLKEAAQFWAEKLPSAAMSAWERILAIAPGDTDALAESARLEFRLNHRGEAKAYRDKLRQVAPNDPRLAELEIEANRTDADVAALADARRLAQAGHNDQAVKLYQQVIRGGPVPLDLAIEYYTALAATSPEGLQQANDAFGQLAAASPNDLHLQLAYAQYLSFHESTRADGIDRLHQLSHDPSVGPAARSAWRQALLWQGPDFQARDQLETYLKENPTDPELEAKREEYKASLPDDGTMARLRGYEAIAAKDLKLAEKEFKSALAFNADDPDSLIMLAAVYRLEKRVAESKPLIDRAIALAPDRRDEFLKDVGGDVKYTYTSRNSGYAIRAEYAEVTRLANAGQYDKAEHLLRRLMGRGGNAGTTLMLADIQARAGRLADAEASYRRAMAMNARNPAAAVGLAALLTREGHTQEAETLYAEAEASYARSGNHAALQTLRRGRAEVMGANAKALTDPLAQISLYRSAVAMDPDDPWLRLEFAQALRKQGQDAEARQVMADVGAGSRASPQALQAALYFAQESGDTQRASQLIARLPSHDLTQQMRETQEYLTVRESVRQIARGGDDAAVRQRLLAIAAQPDPSGVRGSEVGHAFVRMHDMQDAKTAVATALANTPSPTPQQRLAYSGVFLEARLTGDARTVLAGVDRKDLPASQRRSYDEVMNGVAIQQSDELNQQGRQADAYDYLQPRLAAEPQQPDLNLALARLYQANGKQREALAIDEAVLRREPSNADVRRAVVDNAIARGELSRADGIVTQALRDAPKDYRTYLMAADLDQARGYAGRALKDLQTARQLRQQQIATQQ